MESIKTINLTKKYKDLVAVDQLNLQIEQGKRDKRQDPVLQL